jgi:carboxylesterase type B
MAGTTNAETAGWGVGNFPKLMDTSAHITKEELKANILSKYGSNPKFGQSVYDFYISHLDEKNQTAIRQAFAAIFTDEILLCPTYYFAKEFAHLSATGKTYFYVTTYKSKHSGCNKDWMGACHGDDMPFIMGNPITSKSSFNSTDYEFSLMVTQMWTNFAKTGYSFYYILGYHFI